MKIGRNDSCPCGSGLKYKKCCLLKENQIELELDKWLEEDFKLGEQRLKEINEENNELKHM